MSDNSRYIVLDFEKMDTMPISVCSVGLAVIENNEIKDTFYSKIKPPTKSENYYCTLTHGLHYEDVEKSPTYKEIWENKIDKIISDSPIVCHNYGVEKSCINACGEYYGTNTNYNYICTLALSRKYLFYLPSKSLDMVCEELGYNLKNHHNALADAKATAEAFIRLKKKFGLKDEEREQWYTKK